MAKKKKTQLKPVARGFATTSQPKKVVPAAPVEIGDIQDAVNDFSSTPAESVMGECSNATTNTLQDDEFDLEKIEQQSLQNLVDKFQDKVDKEIIRTIKTIEMDRRFSKTLPQLDVDSMIVERVLELVADLEKENRLSPSPGSTPFESEEKMTAKLAVTYGVLRRLGFEQETVDSCLRTIKGVELEEAYEWLYINCPEEELEEKRPTPPQSNEPRTPKGSRALRTPRTPSQFLAAPPAPLSTPGLDINATSFVPSKSGMPTRGHLGNGSSTDSASDVSSSDSDDDPTAQYVKLKLRLDQATENGHPNSEKSASLVRNLRTQLKTLQSSYFFDSKSCDALYKMQRQKLDAASLEARLRGSAAPLPHPKSPKLVKHRPPNLRPLVVDPDDLPVVVADIFDADGEDVSLFELLDEIPTEVNEGTLVTIRDLSYQKNWSGRTPKLLLVEKVASLDKYAIIDYQLVSGASRAKRSSLNIRWTGKQMDEWTMADVACSDSVQSENYIALKALHSLTFPTTDGFASTINTSQTSFRLLPPVFRDLWDELCAARKIHDDDFNRTVWGNLRSIVEGKAEPNKVRGKNVRPQDVTLAVQTKLSISSSDISEHLITSLRARQATPAYQAMLSQRNMLPIAEYRHEITSTLDRSQVLVLSGETGSGKSTQVPSFILEDNMGRGIPCKIFCTEPRRISAISLAERVSLELGDSPGAVGTLNSLVGYSIRLQSHTSKSTRLAYVTSGILLRMLEDSESFLNETNHVLIIDEVHERSIESDFLLIILKGLLARRSDIKVVLMSATLDSEKISAFFGHCPIISVSGRTFPVAVNFLEDAIQFTGWEVTENSPYAKRHDKFSRTKNSIGWSEEANNGDDDEDERDSQEVKLEKRYSQRTTDTINALDERVIPYPLIIRLLECICLEKNEYAAYSAAILIFMPGIAEIRKLNDMLVEHEVFGSNYFSIFPLHSSTSDNQAVFNIPPIGVKKIVIATNVAETGITIPDITCVIDPGRHKEMRFDEKRQISRLVETFVARSNAAQRRGRAGRVQSGLAFHLFTKLRHDTRMADHQLPEMMRLSLSDLALKIKVLNLGNSIANFFALALDPPNPVNVERAINMLVEAGALTVSEEITPLGRLLSKLPTDVYLGKFLLLGSSYKCLDAALTIAASLNSKSFFVTPFGLEEQADRAKASFRIENSDFLTIHNAYSSWRAASANPNFVRKFCRTNFLSQQNLQQIEELRQQFLSYLVDSGFIHVSQLFVRELSRVRYGRGSIRFVHVPPDLNSNASNAAILHAALTAGLYPKLLSIDSTNGQMKTISNNQTASFHPSSVNFGRKPSDFGVRYLAYFTLMHSKKLYAWETAPVDDIAVVLLCGEVDFKLISDTVFIDRKVKFRLSPKANIAVKILRNQIRLSQNDQYRGKIMTESQIMWNELAANVLGKIKLDKENETATAIILTT